MKLLTKLTFVALALSIATSATAGELNQVRDSRIAITVDESTTAETASKERLLERRAIKYVGLTTKQRAEYNEVVEYHNRVIRALARRSKLKALVVEAALDRCRENGYDDSSMYKCEDQLEAKRRHLKVIDDNIHYMKMAASIEDGILDKLSK